MTRDFKLMSDKKSEKSSKINKTLIQDRTNVIFKMFNDSIKENNLLDITKLAHLFKFEISEHNGLPELLNGMITCDTKSNQIAINNKLSKESKRYSIAYLLSTYLLYYKKQDFFIFKHLDSDEDLDASYMARLLLIPETILKNAYIDCGKDIQLLAKLFEVPDGVMEQRIRDVYKTKSLILK